MKRMLLIGFLIGLCCIAVPAMATQYTLYAGQNIPVGYVDVTDNGVGQLTITYIITAEGWEITQTHVAVGDDLADIPQMKGNPIPGKFAYSAVYDPPTQTPDPIIIDVSGLGTPLYIAAHAAVIKTSGCEGDPTIYGTARSDGKLYTIDPLTGVATVLFQTTVAPTSTVSPNGLAYDAGSDRLYYTTYQGNAKLYFYDGTNQIFAGQLLQEVADADFYGGNYYFIAGGTAGSTDDLYEVSFNPNGTILTVTPHGSIAGEAHKWTFGGDIAISSKGLIYGWGSCSVHNTYEFFTVNRDGSGFTLIASGMPRSQQIAFGKDGKLYGHDAQLSTGPFYEINTTTGALTFLANQPLGKTFTDLASEPRCIPLVQPGTAWGFGSSGQVFAGKNWATFFTYTPSG